MIMQFWRPQSAVWTSADAPKNGKCQRPDGFGWPCTHAPHWVIAWVLNPSGLPGQGELHHTAVCDIHVAEALRLVSETHDRPLTLTPYKGVVV